MISIFAPAGIGEVGPETELAVELAAAVATDPSGPLQDGDIVVVTSKIVSKVEGRTRHAAERDAAIDAESLGTVARRGPTRIVRTRHGLTLAAAGVDTSNVSADSVLLLPVDPDASAERLRSELAALTGLRLGVVISDTAGRAWRIGQTDQAIGAAGVQVVERYAGRRDAYGNELQVTAIAIADEVAGAADLVKTKLAGRPVAVVRGLERYVTKGGAPFEGLRERGDGLGERVDGLTEAAETRASVLIREPALDLFRYGSREAVIAAVLEATGQAGRFEEVLARGSDEELVIDVMARSGTTGAGAELLRRVLAAGLGPSSPPAAS